MKFNTVQNFAYYIMLAMRIESKNGQYQKKSAITSILMVYIAMHDPATYLI